MKSKRKRKSTPSSLEKRLAELEEMASERGIQVHYDRLEAAGLKLKGGICSVKGDYHLFIDKRKSTADKIEFLKDYLSTPIPENAPPDGE
ncbi:MAG: hypothetical protein JRF51_00020 [Deltaproteobacteria bacterium]|nr:hypothetical protein [Deltaproteobacteria bacterium]MBW2351597.1 hypothetical protein [Deltaproteobacteria bacterium]HDZ89548.1 hypothetical protein [Deltaproteobacteria bacterium]